MFKKVFCLLPNAGTETKRYFMKDPGLRAKVRESRRWAYLLCVTLAKNAVATGQHESKESPLLFQVLLILRLVLGTDQILCRNKQVSCCYVLSFKQVLPCSP